MNAIVAVDSRWGIGYKGRLLFSIPEDMRNFKRMTLGRAVVMGRKTLLSLPGGRPLPERENIVLTHSSDFKAEKVSVIHSTAELLRKLSAYNPGNVFCIGGAEIYRLLLPYCNTAYITKVFREKPADCFFPDLDADTAWKSDLRSDIMTSGDLEFQFCRYVNKKPLKQYISH
ncbi:MAG: dihydrofolate reductase [Oscillospiraceae bacterium]|nr:dihydrofolate reductase [Oscillospiraceae bacterium]